MLPVPNGTSITRTACPGSSSATHSIHPPIGIDDGRVVSRVGFDHRHTVLQRSHRQLSILQFRDAGKVERRNGADLGRLGRQPGRSVREVQVIADNGRQPSQGTVLHRKRARADAVGLAAEHDRVAPANRQHTIDEASGQPWGPVFLEDRGQYLDPSQSDRAGTIHQHQPRNRIVLQSGRPVGRIGDDPSEANRDPATVSVGESVVSMIEAASAMPSPIAGHPAGHFFPLAAVVVTPRDPKRRSIPLFSWPQR